MNNTLPKISFLFERIMNSLDYAFELALSITRPFLVKVQATIFSVSSISIRLYFLRSCKSSLLIPLGTPVSAITLSAATTSSCFMV
jgi:hypothetical protein